MFGRVIGQQAIDWLAWHLLVASRTHSPLAFSGFPAGIFGKATELRAEDLTIGPWMSIREQCTRDLAMITLARVLYTLHALLARKWKTRSACLTSSVPWLRPSPSTWTEELQNDVVDSYVLRGLLLLSSFLLLTDTRFIFDIHILLYIYCTNCIIKKCLLSR